MTDRHSSILPSVDLKSLQRSDILIVAAMREELGSLSGVKGPRFCFTGIGKVNASYFLMRSIRDWRPKLVLNFGSVGSPKFKTHSLVEVVEFHQRDMNLAPLGFQEGVTPFDPIGGDIQSESCLRYLGIEPAVCSTADRFEVSGHLIKGDVVDMEAFALAKVCMHESLAFLCVKYVTDGADDTSHTTWEQNLPLAAQKFKELFLKLFSN